MLKSSFRYTAIAFTIIALNTLLFPISSSGWLNKPGNNIETSCGEENTNGKRILIAYDTGHGSTRTVAYKIQEVLCQHGAQVDLSLARKIKDVSMYDAVIAGSAIYMETWLPDAMNFLKEQKDVLSNKSVAYFIVCGYLREDTDERHEKAKKYYIDPLLEKIPEIIPIGNPGLFGGMLDYSELTPIESLVILLFQMPEDDYRNFDKITSWTEDLISLLEQ